MARKTAFFLLTAGLAAGTALYWLDFARFEILANTVTDLATAQAAQETQAVPPPPKVPVAQVVVRDAAPWTELTGYVSATESVDIRPRVGGFIEAVTVPEGKFVKKGELLFQIDPRPLQAALGRVRAELSQAEAGLIQAEADYARAEELLRRGVASRKTHDDAIANLRLREAEVRRSKASVEAAELELSYTRIDAPIAGRVDRVLVTTGNLVNGGNAGEAPVLTSIVSIDPVHVYFDIDEATYLDLAGRASDGQAIDKLPVEIGLVGDEGFPLKGNLDFVANEVDRGTGTIRARAVVPNPDGRLFPGLFARVKLPLDEPRPTILIGDEAIGSDQGKSYVLVLSKDDTAEYRPIQLGPIIDDLRAVRSGLNAGESIIVKGLVRPGMKVSPNLTAMPGDAEAQLDRTTAASPIEPTGLAAETPESSELASAQGARP